MKSTRTPPLLPILGLVYRSAKMRQLAEEIHLLSQTQFPILLTGETGTGKEVVARAIHTLSPRRKHDFVAYNCAAVPPYLMESQLFGHKKGAFTGAVENAPGVIRAAANGTLLLDEIGDLPLDLQPKLLRFLQEGEIHVVGEGRPRKVDVRLIAATNHNLMELIAHKRFRPDLYHRLNIAELHLPPLRERIEDLPVLIDYFLKLYGAEENKPGLFLQEDALAALLRYDWPGNVRELSSELQRAVALAEPGSSIGRAGLSAKFQMASRFTALAPDLSATEKPPSDFRFSPAMTLLEIKLQFEKEWILEAMKRHEWNLTEAAPRMGLTRQTLRKKIRAYGLTRRKNPTSLTRKW